VPWNQQKILREPRDGHGSHFVFFTDGIKEVNVDVT
jgi:hypothetical protein